MDRSILNRDSNLNSNYLRTLGSGCLNLTLEVRTLEQS